MFLTKEKKEKKKKKHNKSDKQTKIHTLTQTHACTGKELNEKESQTSTQQTTLKVIYEAFL